MNAASARPGRLADIPIVFLSYDEPWADEAFADLKALRADALRVSGVKGLDACHKAAAEAAGSDWFLTVDADTAVDPGAFDVEVPERLLQPVFRLDWLSRNAVNGLVSGNGCLKLWPRDLAMDMRSHEAAQDGRVSLDHEIGAVKPGVTRQVTMPGCIAHSNPARTPYHAFRAGFRETVFLMRLKEAETIAGRLNPGAATSINAILGIWCMIGAHVRNGLWMIYGARLGVWSQLAWSGWDPREMNDYGWFERLWDRSVLPRIGPGDRRCAYTDLRWDEGHLQAEIGHLANQISAQSDLALADIGAEASCMIVESSAVAAVRTAPSLDAVGRAFQLGEGVPVDIPAAREFYEIGVVLRKASAFTNLGRLHQLGLIEDADEETAEALYSVAMQLGSAHAPFHLAKLLSARDSEDPPDQPRIDALFDLAASRGFSGPANNAGRR